MDQRKIGEHLKELRKAKGVTQEVLADQLGVSRRTVSRWETGSNMPDLDIIVLLADYYDVDVREIFKGEATEAKEIPVEKTANETAMLSAEYDNSVKAKIMRRFSIMYIIGAVGMALYIATIFIPAFDTDEGIIGMFRGGFLGAAFGMLLLGIMITTSDVLKLYEKKKKFLQRAKKLVDKDVPSDK